MKRRQAVPAPRYTRRGFFRAVTDDLVGRGGRGAKRIVRPQPARRTGGPRRG